MRLLTIRVVTGLWLAALLALAAGRALAAGPGVEGCVPCHGADGIARDAEVPNLAAQNVPYLYHQLKAFKSGSRKHPEMHYMSRHMSDAEMQMLAEYYGSLPAR